MNLFATTDSRIQGHLREKLRRRLPILTKEKLPPLGLVTVEDIYVDRRERPKILTIYVLRSGPATGEFFKMGDI